MSKSRFDRGSTLGNGRWDEEEHPRGKDGRFVDSGGVEGKDFTRDKNGKKISVGDTILAHDGSLGKVVEVRDGDIVAEDTKTHEKWSWFSNEIELKEKSRPKPLKKSTGRQFTTDKNGSRVQVGDTIHIYDGSKGKVLEVHDGDVVAEDTVSKKRWSWFSREFRVSKQSWF